MKMEETGLSREEIEKFVDNYVFSARDRKIVKQRWFNRTTHERLAEKYNLSPRHIKRIVGIAEERLCQHFSIDKK